MNQHGFSLFELMVVLAIIGILAGLAIPNYQRYVIKAKMIDLFTQIYPSQLAITEALITQTPPAQINNSFLGIEVIKQEGLAEEISFEKGIIMVRANTQKLGMKGTEPLTIRLIPEIKTSKIQWICEFRPEQAKTFAPAHCL